MHSVLLASGLALASAQQWVAPWFCHDLDCPKFTNPQNMTIDGKTVEIRNYEASLWSSTVVLNTDLQDAEHDGFEKNFDYITGENSAKTDINMTSPVTTYIQPAQGPYCSTNFTVSFYVPYAFQPPNSPPPKPTDPTVSLVEYPAMTVAVLSFEGFGEQDVVIAEAAELSKLLGQSGLTYDQENWFQAGYDPPFRVSGRHNEVWIQVYDTNVTKAKAN